MCYLQNTPSSLFPLAASFCLSPILSCVQTPTHTHSCISCPHPTPYAVDMLFLSFAWWKSRVFHAPAQFFTPNLHFPGTSLICDVFILHAFLPFLLSWTHPVAPFPTHVCCPEQSRLCQLVNGVEKSDGDSLRVSSCQPQKPSKYPALELGVSLDETPGDEYRLNHAWKFPGITATAEWTPVIWGISRDRSSEIKMYPES